MIRDGDFVNPKSFINETFQAAVELQNPFVFILRSVLENVAVTPPSHREDYICGAIGQGCSISFLEVFFHEGQLNEPAANF